MGRKIPLTENQTINPILSLSLLVTCIAATIAIVSSMCGFCWRKKSSSQHENSDESVLKSNKAKSAPENGIAISPSKDNDDLSNMSQELERQIATPPPPPAPSFNRHSRASSYHFRSNSNVSLGKLTSSMSMKVQGGIKAIRQTSRREKKEKDDKHEDSLWKKQIILGGKCRIEDEEDDDMAIFDENGHRISAYRKKPLGPITMSTQSSNVDANAIPI